jgi:hypothetical protein
MALQRGGPAGAAVRAAEADAGPGDDGPARGEERLPGGAQHIT